MVKKTTPVAKAPELISREEYVADAKARWAIHSHEVKELSKDLRKVYEYLVPLVKEYYVWGKARVDKYLQDYKNKEK